METIDDLFPFLNLVYEEGMIPEIHEFNLFDFDEKLLDEVGFEEVVKRKFGRKLDYAKYYAVVKCADCEEHVIEFDFSRTVMMMNGQIIFQNEALSLRDQLQNNEKIEERNILFIFLIERCEETSECQYPFRSLTIFRTDNTKNSFEYDACVSEVYEKISDLEDQSKTLDDLKKSLESE